MKTPRVHHAARRRGGGVAADGAGTAARADAADWRAHELAADDTDSPVRVAAFAQGLQELGWIIGRNIRVEYRWSAGETDRIRTYAAEISRSRRMSSSLLAARTRPPCNRRRLTCRSCFWG